MQIKVDDQEVFSLSETQMNVIKNDIHEDQFNADMNRRLEWVLTHKYEQCYERLKKEWEPKLAGRGVEYVPTNPDAFAQLVFSQPDYKSRKACDLASQQV